MPRASRAALLGPIERPGPSNPAGALRHASGRKAKRGDTGLPAACARKGIAASSSVQPTIGVPAGPAYEWGELRSSAGPKHSSDRDRSAGRSSRARRAAASVVSAPAVQPCDTSPATSPAGRSRPHSFHRRAGSRLPVADHASGRRAASRMLRRSSRASTIVSTDALASTTSMVARPKSPRTAASSSAACIGLRRRSPCGDRARGRRSAARARLRCARDSRTRLRYAFAASSSSVGLAVAVLEILRGAVDVGARAAAARAWRRQRSQPPRCYPEVRGASMRAAIRRLRLVFRLHIG